MQKLKDAGLTALIETLPPSERYSYVFDGNSQALDHIMVSDNLMSSAAAAAGYDILHVNSEFIDQISDHDPQLVRLTLRPSYAYVCELAKEYASEKKVAQRLCDKLRQAEHAEAQGKIDKRNDLLDGFIDIVEEQRGRSLTDAEAATLIALAEALKQS